MGTAAETPARALRARGISVEFGGVTVLHDVGLTVTSNAITGLIGPNGAGKTTLINVLSGFQTVNAGDVVLDSTVLTGMPAHWIARNGLSRTFQGGRLFARMTIFENVYVSALSAGVRAVEARARARSLLEYFGLGHRVESFASDIPYGEERLLSLARSLATMPRYLLLDEPAAGLNEIETRVLAGALASIPANFGCGVLVVEHDMDLIMGTCDRVFVLAHGANLSEGTPKEVSRDPAVIREYLGGEADAA